MKRNRLVQIHLETGLKRRRRKRRGLCDDNDDDDDDDCVSGVQRAVLAVLLVATSPVRAVTSPIVSASVSIIIRCILQYIVSK